MQYHEQDKTMEKIKQELLTIIENQFNESIQLQTKFSDIDQWDSLTHMLLIQKIETHFKIKFDIFDMLNFESIDHIYQAILKAQ